MIIDEFKSDSTLIRFDDRDIETKENNEDILNILVGLIPVFNTIRKSPAQILSRTDID